MSESTFSNVAAQIYILHVVDVIHLIIPEYKSAGNKKNGGNNYTHGHYFPI